MLGEAAEENVSARTVTQRADILKDQLELLQLFDRLVKYHVRDVGECPSHARVDTRLVGWQHDPFLQELHLFLCFLVRQLLFKVSSYSALT